MGFRTKHFKAVFSKDVADYYYNTLVNNVKWEDGIKSRRHGFTRKAKPVSMGENEHVDEIFKFVFDNIEYKPSICFGLYLNYYRDGNDFTPNHSHKGTKQIVISLGETRILKVGKKEYKLDSGDVVVFGSSIHGVPKDTNITKGRISIAAFCM